MSQHKLAAESTTIKLSGQASPKRFAIFVVTVLVAMAASGYVATLILLKSTFSEVQQDYVTEVGARVRGNIDFYVRTHMAALADHARLPRLVNAAMNSSGSAASVVDRLRQLKLLDSDAHLSLLDIEGAVIAQNFDSVSPPGPRPWVANIVDGDLAQVAEMFSRPDTAELWIRYVVPVQYNGLPEGLLVAEQIVDATSLLSSISHDENQYLVQFSTGEKILGQLGDGDIQESSDHLVVPTLTSDVTLFVNTHSINSDLYELLLVNVVVSIALVSLFLWFFRRIGNRLFVLPLQQLAVAQQSMVQTNARLEIANDELSQFAYRSSHDLRAPLATVLGLTKFAISDLQSGDVEETKENLVKIRLHVEKLDRLVGDILEMSRADLKDVEMSKVDVIAIAKKLQESLTADDFDKVEFRYDDKVNQPFYSQETRITQVLENLLSNAVKYRSSEVDQSYVAVKLTSDDTNLYLEVSDNGIGIPKDRFKDVFGMFKRFHPTVALGSGLGMSIVKKHIDRLGGKIGFDSSAEGTNIKIEFPLAT